MSLDVVDAPILCQGGRATGSRGDDGCVARGGAGGSHTKKSTREENIFHKKNYEKARLCKKGRGLAWSTGARATSWSRLEYPDNLKFLVQEISGLKIKIRTEFLAIFCILNTFFRQARTARHRTAAGPRGHGGPDGDIPTALMPRTLGTVSSSTLVGNSDKWCVGRARPRVARSASRRVSI